MLSFPFTKILLVMYYNLDKLRTAGFPKAPENWTWGDFASGCKAVSHGDTRGWAIAVSASTFDGMVYSRGGRLIADDQRRWLFNDPAGIDSIAFHQTAVKEGWGYRISQPNGDQADFSAARAAFTFSASSGFAFYKSEVDKGGRFTWSVSMLPRGDYSDGGEPSTVLYGGSLAVFRSTPKRQLAAWLFLKYFSSPEVTAEWSTATGYMPVRQSAVDSEMVQAEMRANPPYGVVVGQIARHGRPETSVRGTQDTRGFIEDAITRSFPTQRRVRGKRWTRPHKRPTRRCRCRPAAMLLLAQAVLSAIG